MAQLLTGRPLLETGPDAELFVPNEPIFSRLGDAIRARQNLLVAGDRGVGKTTLLRQLKYRVFGSESRDAVFVKGELARDASELVALIQEELGRIRPDVAAARGAQLGIPEWLQGRDTPAGQLLDLVRGLRSQNGATVFLDGLPNAEVGHTIFGRLRDEIWELPHAWVVAVARREYSALRRPPADAFFDMTFVLAPMEPIMLERILRKRTDGRRALPVARENEIIAGSKGNPRRLLELARRALSEPGDLSRSIQARAWREAEAAGLGRGHSMLVAEMEERGPVSASDQDLLRSLGWTRNRATQVLRDLEAAGIAVSSNARSEKGGTRRLYELTTPTGIQ